MAQRLAVVTDRESARELDAGGQLPRRRRRGGSTPRRAAAPRMVMGVLSQAASGGDGCLFGVGEAGEGPRPESARRHAPAGRGVAGVGRGRQLGSGVGAALASAPSPAGAPVAARRRSAQQRVRGLGRSGRPGPWQRSGVRAIRRAGSSSPMATAKPGSSGEDRVCSAVSSAQKSKPPLRVAAAVDEQRAAGGVGQPQFAQSVALVELAFGSDVVDPGGGRAHLDRQVGHARGARRAEVDRFGEPPDVAGEHGVSSRRTSNGRLTVPRPASDWVQASRAA